MLFAHTLCEEIFRLNFVSVLSAFPSLGAVCPYRQDKDQWALQLLPRHANNDLDNLKSTTFQCQFNMYQICHLKTMQLNKLKLLFLTYVGGQETKQEEITFTHGYITMEPSPNLRPRIILRGPFLVMPFLEEPCSSDFLGNHEQFLFAPHNITNIALQGVVTGH